jgi:uncharacterized protein YneF (UPF0154 family)
MEILLIVLLVIVLTILVIIGMAIFIGITLFKSYHKAISKMLEAGLTYLLFGEPKKKTPRPNHTFGRNI